MGQVAEDPGAPSVFVACHGRPDVLSSLCVACASGVRTCVDVTRLCAGTFPENPECRYKILSKNEPDDVHHKNAPCMSEYQQQLHHIHKQASSVRGPRRPSCERYVSDAVRFWSHHCVARACRRMIASRWRLACRRVWRWRLSDGHLLGICGVPYICFTNMIQGDLLWNVIPLCRPTPMSL